MQMPPEQVKRLADEYIKDALTKVEEARFIEEAETSMETGESLLKFAVILSALTASVVLIKNSAVMSRLEYKTYEGENSAPSFVEG
ncbi:MAG: hypothetical protein AMJ88_04850 [Anaerolineae bacterium SM23_ 63]|nr:MAG: hypothetical protein AMJ88_04850 [Anaerolineae bacterium SM23_ 63]HEY47903.1 hypothetical protein [Anaerolineae bacterium]